MKEGSVFEASSARNSVSNLVLGSTLSGASASGSRHYCMRKGSNTRELDRDQGFGKVREDQVV